MSNSLKFFLSVLAFFSLRLAGIAQNKQVQLSIYDFDFNKYYFSTSRPIVNGKIINASKEELTHLAVTYSLVTPFPNAQVKGTTEIKEDGSFSFKLDHPFPYQQIWFSLGDYFYCSLYLKTEINLELDFSKLKRQSVLFNGDGVRYLGKDGPATLWMNELVLYRKDDQLAIDQFAKGKFNEKEYRAKTDSLNNLTADIQNEFIRLNPSPYSWMAENERLSRYYGALLSYSSKAHVKNSRWKQIKKHKSKIISNNARIFNSQLYNYAYRQTAKMNDSSFIQLLGIPYSDALKLSVSTGDLKEDEKFLTNAIAVTKTPWVKSILQDQQNIISQRLNLVNTSIQSGKFNGIDTVLGKSFGKVSSNKDLYIANDINANVFLKKLGSKFKGKAMVLDFWATWCAPCIAEMPNSLKLQKQATELPIEFIYLCTSSGSNIQRWEKVITEMNQSGTHVFISEKLTNELMALFNVGGFPSYIYFDQNGQVSKSLANIGIGRLTIEDLKKLIVK